MGEDTLLGNGTEVVGKGYVRAMSVISILREATRRKASKGVRHDWLPGGRCRGMSGALKSSGFGGAEEMITYSFCAPRSEGEYFSRESRVGRVSLSMVVHMAILLMDKQFIGLVTALVQHGIEAQSYPELDPNI